MNKSKVFKVEKRQLTAKTVAYVASLDDIFCYQCGKKEAAENIARVFTDNQIYSIEKFKALNNNIRVSFISATNQTAPHFDGCFSS